jgi:hypothetical protein
MQRTKTNLSVLAEGAKVPPDPLELQDEVSLEKT